ncbi:alpha/beta hydrolase [Nocardia vulneris]|uniref:poly(ethylene terephthalate) hydrolase family protein n=1 Tax=Nocardia vulneris TaxID=1141657 RepID=UPI000AF9199C|nr:alpha/beta hydrolase [Nocardia vulneris]
MPRIRRRHCFAAMLAIAALLSPATVHAPVAAATGFDPGPTPLSQYAPTGPHQTDSTAQTYPCESLYGLYNVITKAFGNHTDMPCTHAFPAGLEPPAGVDFYYPHDIATMSRVPVVIWVPGLTNNPGNYDALARFWASHGFVVAIPYNFFNSFFELPLAAAMALARADHDPASLLNGRLDLGRTVIGGHSGGGAAAIDGASIALAVYQQIDPDLRVIGAFPTESSPYATTFLVGVPTLFLSGSADFLVPEFLPRWAEYELSFNAPAFVACLRGATHFTPWDDIAHDPFAGITLAWLLYLANADPTAASYFIGPDWRLRVDPALVYAIRNVRADNIPN